MGGILTKYHAQYFAYELTRSRAADDQGKFTASLQDATVDLNPHQVEAALFAFKSPLSKGALLADEVGLGKTIEAGIILSQKWAERKRKLLIIAPANLRKQWNQELADKFFLPSTIIEATSYKQMSKRGNLNPFEEEQKLYDDVSGYLRSDKLYALPASQRHLMTMILRKLLSSSTFAIQGTLQKLANKLEAHLEGQSAVQLDDIAEEYESFDELAEEWDDNDEPKRKGAEPIPLEERALALEEKEKLQRFAALASTIQKNSKGVKLLTALTKGFEKLQELGAAKKAIIFTESTRTQQYLKEILETQGYAGQIVLFNGTNNDEYSRSVYAKWLQHHAGTDRISGSHSADKRQAIVDCFRDQATIMIATEAAAEGINLQFCSLVVNYDIPWNPQRIEQRIGRCHRYGQKFDVVVINFLNKANAADQRVYQLLDEKFKLFSGVFGASDEVLGAIESGVDFEKRIARIYKECRTAQEIQEAFDILEASFEEERQQKLDNTKQQLLENFYDEVHQKLRVNLQQGKEYLNMFEQRLWAITELTLNGNADFHHKEFSFTLKANPFQNPAIHLGHYQLLKSL